MIRLENVKKVYKGDMFETVALEGVSFEIADGSFVAIMGESGSGKTTLMNVIGAIDKPTEGKIYIDDVDIAHSPQKVVDMVRKKNMCFVFQHFALMSQYTVFENIESPLTARNINKTERKKIVLEVAKELGIDDLLRKYPNQISGGQRQRTAIARAMAADCRIIFADEPTGALDHDNSVNIMDIFKTLNEKGKTIIVITHDKNVADYADTIIKLSDGRVEGVANEFK
jgi:putative ABC transport system ATP-binding protein